MEMTVTQAALSERLQLIESRIRLDLANAYEKVVDIGRCLQEVKDEGLVPHGEWESWVQRVAGMNIRQAQRWMQIAREVPEGSYLSQLQISQMREVLTLPEAQREEVAKAAVEQGTDTKELKKQIAAMKKALKEAKESEESAWENARVQASYAQEQEQKRIDMQAKLREAEKGNAEKGISAEAAREIEILKGKLKDAEVFGQVQAEKRQAAQDELMRLRHGGSAQQDESQLFTGAVLEFLRQAGTVPHMGKEFAGMPERQRRIWEKGVGMIAAWVRDSESALNHISGEVV